MIKCLDIFLISPPIHDALLGPFSNISSFHFTAGKFLNSIEIKKVPYRMSFLHRKNESSPYLS
jgi:hypothetical protein